MKFTRLKHSLISELVGDIKSADIFQQNLALSCIQNK